MLTPHPKTIDHQSESIDTRCLTQLAIRLLRVALVVLLLLSVLAPVLVPVWASAFGTTTPEVTDLVVPYSVAAILFIGCGQVALLAVWRLLSFVGDGVIFTRRGVRWSTSAWPSRRSPRCWLTGSSLREDVLLRSSTYLMEPRRSGALAARRMAVAASILLVAVVVLTSAGNSDALAMLSRAPLLLLAGVVVGWPWRPRALSLGRRQRAIVISAVAITASVAGAGAVATMLWLVTFSRERLDPSTSQIWGVHWLPLLWLAGILWFGLPSLLITLPMAVSWRRETAERVQTGR